MQREMEGVVGTRLPREVIVEEEDREGAHREASR